MIKPNCHNSCFPLYLAIYDDLGKILELVYLGISLDGTSTSTAAHPLLMT